MATDLLGIRMAFSSQLFLTQFSKNILIPNDEQLSLSQPVQEGIPTEFAREFPRGVHSGIDLPMQVF